VYFLKKTSLKLEDVWQLRNWCYRGTYLSTFQWVRPLFLSQSWCSPQTPATLHTLQTVPSPTYTGPSCLESGGVRSKVNFTWHFIHRSLLTNNWNAINFLADWLFLKLHLINGWDLVNTESIQPQTDRRTMQKKFTTTSLVWVGFALLTKKRKVSLPHHIYQPLLF